MQMGPWIEDLPTFVPSPNDGDIKPLTDTYADEVKWLDTELAAGGQRFSAALSTSMFSRRTAANAFDGCIRWANFISSFEQADTARNWLHLAVALNQDDLVDHFGNFGMSGGAGLVDLMFRRTTDAILLRVIESELP